MNRSALISSVNDDGRLMLLASSRVAPLVDKLRTTHATPLSSNETVAPFSTLCRRTALLSTVLLLIVVARVFVLLNLAWWSCGLINLIGSVQACQFMLGLR